MAQNFANLPTGLVPLFQQNFLARFLEEGLDSELAYRRHAIVETIPGRIGQTITLSRTGRKPPVPTPLTAANLNSNLDNGLTQSDAPVEQYSYNMLEYGDTVDVDLLGEIATIADNFKKAARNNGVQGAQTLERIAKNRIFAAYNGGNSFVRGDLGSNTTGTVHVDDIRGFQFVSVAGQLTAVSGTNPLTVTEYPSTSGGVSQTFTVTAVTADGTNNSVYPSDAPGVLATAGVSGTLTISPVATSVPVAGDGLVAANAPQVLRPSGKTATTQLNSGDVMTLGLALDARTVLLNNAVPTFPDGTYHMILDNTSMRQLFADQQFLVAYAAQYKSNEYMSGQIFQLLGITFIPTTEAYVQPLNAAAVTAGLLTQVRRPILMGAESLLQGNFEGLELWLNRDGLDPIGSVMIVDGIAQMVRPPIDRMLRYSGLTWTWIGDFAVPTDVTANSSIIPTASSALYKRCVVMETAG